MLPPFRNQTSVYESRLVLRALLLSTTRAVANDTVDLKCKCRTILLNKGLKANEFTNEEEDLSLAPIKVDLSNSRIMETEEPGSNWGA